MVGESFRPPRMQNTDGQDLVFHTLRWRCPDPDGVDAALGRAGLRAEDGGREWSLMRDSARQPNTVIAHVRLDGDELVAEVNSDERARELRELVAGAMPEAELLEDEERSFDEAMSDVDADDLPPGPNLDDPMIRQALREFIADHERRWLDESIPALGGRTPREAAVDPIGREELEHLLESFPRPGPDDVGAMDPDRLRKALDL
jgi:hypothetical protein